MLEGDALREFKANHQFDEQLKFSTKLYLWTERGALLHAKSLNTDRAWEVYDRLVETYFRATVLLKGKPVKPGKTEAQLAAETKRADAMLLNAKNRTASFLKGIYDAANVKPEYQALALGELFSDDGVKLPRIALAGTKVTYDKGTIADRLGVLSKNGNPHAQAVGAIIGNLTIDDDETEAVPFHRHGHDGTDIQYTESVIQKVDDWIAAHEYPSVIIGSSGKSYSVTYRKSK